jgi:hypothetical protein
MASKDCTGCKFEEFDDAEDCDGCSRLEDTSCSCHINPPCAVCMDDYYTPKE